MKTPKFYDEVESITLFDPLSNILGASENGLLTYTYTDVVKLAGHSCPTVAGAYLMAQKGLAALYGESLPVRGEIKVSMRGKLGDGVVGVVSNVASFITGATTTGGFHGLAGKYDRRNLLEYGAPFVDGDMKLTRLDTGKSVTLRYDHSCVPFDPAMERAMGLALSSKATAEDIKAFGQLWQKRVGKILTDFRDDKRLVRLVENI